MNDDIQPKHRARGRTGQLGKINRIRNRSRPRSDFVLHIIKVEEIIANNKAAARARHGT